MNISKYELSQKYTQRQASQDRFQNGTKETQKEESASERESLGFDDEYIIKNQDI